MAIVENLSKPKVTFTASKNKFSPAETASAFRTVISFTLTDVFDLTPEETLWVSYLLCTAMEPFESLTAKYIPTPVMQELTTREYSNRLAAKESGDYIARNADVQNADLQDWVDIIMEMISSSYEPLRPMTEAIVRGHISGLLTELGVGIEKSPRGALYLPNSVRYSLAAKSTDQ